MVMERILTINRTVSLKTRLPELLCEVLASMSKYIIHRQMYDFWPICRYLLIVCICTGVYRQKEKALGIANTTRVIITVVHWLLYWDDSIQLPTYFPKFNFILNLSSYFRLLKYQLSILVLLIPFLCSSLELVQFLAHCRNVVTQNTWWWTLLAQLY
jgi:hypothetical protein